MIRKKKNLIANTVIKFAVLLLFFWCMVTITGCTPSAGSVAGTKWVLTEYGHSLNLEFLQDNTYKTEIGDGKWSMSNDGRIIMEEKSLDGSSLTRFAKIEGNKLIVTNDGNKGQTIFEKVN